MLKEFREFALRGNVVDMAVGIIIGAAFGTIVKSLVDDILMPPIGKVLGGVDFSDFYLVLGSRDPAGPYTHLADAQAAGAVTLNYGLFINNVISFLIVAFAMFLIIRSMNRLAKMREAPEPAVPTTRACPFCISDIPIKATRCPYCTSELQPAG